MSFETLSIRFRRKKMPPHYIKTFYRAFMSCLRVLLFASFFLTISCAPFCSYTVALMRTRYNQRRTITYI